MCRRRFTLISQLHRASTHVVVPAMLGVMLAAGAHAQTVKPGLWEVERRQSKLVQGRQALDLQKIQQQLEAQLQSMAPEARRLVEENLRSAGVVLGQGHNARVCVLPEYTHLARLAERLQQDGCSFGLQERGADFVRGRLQCSEPAAQGSYTATVSHPERLSSHTELNTPKGQLFIQASAQWLGADCGDAPIVGKPSDPSRDRVR